MDSADEHGRNDGDDDEVSAPTRVMQVRTSLMKSAVRLPGRLPGMKPPYLRMLSAVSSGRKTMGYRSRRRRRS